MANKKKYIITAITLGVIAATSGTIIGLSNLATRDKIAQNELDKINNGIVEIFGKNTSINEEFDANGQKYVVKGYSIKGGETADKRYAFKTTGTNSYGKITLLIGFEQYANMNTDEFFFVKLSIIVDEQTFSSILEEKYINPLNTEGESKLSDVDCGATYGAKLVKSMVDEARDYVNANFKNE